MISVLFASLASASGRVGMETDVAPEDPTSIAGWNRVGAAPRSTNLEIVFAVKQQNTGALETLLLEISDPRHASYGQQLSREQVNTLVAPAAASVAAVVDFVDGVRFARSDARDALRPPPRPPPRSPSPLFRALTASHCCPRRCSPRHSSRVRLALRATRLKRATLLCALPSPSPLPRRC